MSIIGKPSKKQKKFHIIKFIIFSIISAKGGREKGVSPILKNSIIFYLAKASLNMKISDKLIL